MYYRLNSDCLLIASDDSGIVYELANGKEHHITNKIEKDILCLLEENVSIEELKDKYTNNNVINLLNTLKQNKLGRFFDTKVYIERIKPINMNFVKMGKTPLNNINRIAIELTGKCNLDCKFCSQEKIVYRKCGCKKWDYSHEFSDKKWQSVCEQIVKISPKEIIFSGGEPLIRKNLFKILCRKFYENNIKVKMFTNATLINEEIALFLKEYNVDLAVHIISNNESLYDSITGKQGGYNLFKKGLELIAKHKINTIGVMLVNKYNINEYDKIKDEISSLKIEMQFQNEYNNDTSSELNSKIYDRNYSKISINLFNYQVLTDYNNCLFGQMFISNEGILYPCMMMRDFPLGDINNKKLWKIISESEYKKFWELSKSKIEKCCSCENRLSCFDCRAMEYYATKNITGLKYCSKQ